MPRVDVVSLDNQDIESDSRVQRQIRYLSRQHSVRVVTYGRSPTASVPGADVCQVVGSLSRGKWSRRLLTLALLPLGRVLGPWVYERWYWWRPGHREAEEILRQWRGDVIQANDWWTLPVAVRAARATGAKVVLDMHEYALDEFSSRWWQIFYRPVVAHFLRACLPHVTATATVNRPIADRYEREFGVHPVVVMNAPEAVEEVEGHPVRADRIRLVHHGAAQRARRLETMIEALALADARFDLTFILLGDERYIADLKRHAQRLAPGRVTFAPAVKPKDLLRTLAQFDMGFYVLPGTQFNFLASLPNKFFEFVCAGLGVCIGPSPAMADLANKHQFGAVAPSFDPKDVARVLNQLSVAQIEAMREGAARARRVLNAENELQHLLDLYTQLGRTAETC